MSESDIKIATKNNFVAIKSLTEPCMFVLLTVYNDDTIKCVTQRVTFFIVGELNTTEQGNFRHLQMLDKLPTRQVFM